MAAFVGFTEKAEHMREIDGEMITEDLLNKPQLVTNWTQYVERYGEFVPGAYLPHSVYGYFKNGGTRCYVVSVRTIRRAQAALLSTDGKPHLIARPSRPALRACACGSRSDAPELPAAPRPRARPKARKKKRAAAEAIGHGPAFT